MCVCVCVSVRVCIHICIFVLRMYRFNYQCYAHTCTFLEAIPTALSSSALDGRRQWLCHP